jgi:hypothetical protein
MSADMPSALLRLLVLWRSLTDPVRELAESSLARDWLAFCLHRVRQRSDFDITTLQYAWSYQLVSMNDFTVGFPYLFSNFPLDYSFPLDSAFTLLYS